MGGCQIDILVSFSQDFYFVLFIRVFGCKLETLYSSRASLQAELCNNWSDSIGRLMKPDINYPLSKKKIKYYVQKEP